MASSNDTILTAMGCNEIYSMKDATAKSCESTDLICAKNHMEMCIIISSRNKNPTDVLTLTTMLYWSNSDIL